MNGPTRTRTGDQLGVNELSSAARVAKISAPRVAARPWAHNSEEKLFL